MIEVEVPVTKIPFVRTIEGRKFLNGKWQFPDSAAPLLIQLDLIPENTVTHKKEVIEFELSPHLRKHQKEICNLALNKKSLGIFADTGTGKTVIGLEIASHHKKTLVLCPLSVIETAWIDDCHRFYPGKTIVNVWANSAQERRNKLAQDADIYVMNYESFKILRNDIRKAGFDCLIVDESSVMKNMNSQITTILLQFIDVIPHRFVMSGCPTPNHNSEVFPQMKLVNPEVFGNNYYGFLARYFHQDMANPHVWYQTDEDKDRYFARLRTQSVFLKKEDCVDLPDKIFSVRQFDLSPEQRLYYDELENDIRQHINEWSKIEFTAKLMKQREIVSGFVIQKDKSITTFDSNKHRALKEIIEEIGNKPIIVWCQFKHEIETLAKEFGGTALTSGTRNRDEIIRAFRDNQIHLLFTHPKLLGKGVTFVNCTYNIYYSLSFSYEEFKQSQDRIHRIGQENKCTYIILQAKDTNDIKIYSSLMNKGNAVDELYYEMAKPIS